LKFGSKASFKNSRKPNPGHKERVKTVAKSIERLGLAEEGSKISGDFYWMELRAPVSRQKFMGMLAYYYEIIKKKSLSPDLSSRLLQIISG
jgi:hypothetical protein